MESRYIYNGTLFGGHRKNLSDFRGRDSVRGAADDPIFRVKKSIAPVFPVKKGFPMQVGSERCSTGQVSDRRSVIDYKVKVVETSTHISHPRWRKNGG